MLAAHASLVTSLAIRNQQTARFSHVCLSQCADLRVSQPCPIASFAPVPGLSVCKQWSAHSNSFSSSLTRTCLQPAWHVPRVAWPVAVQQLLGRLCCSPSWHFGLLCELLVSAEQCAQSLSMFSHVFLVATRRSTAALTAFVSTRNCCIVTNLSHHPAACPVGTFQSLSGKSSYLQCPPVRTKSPTVLTRFNQGRFSGATPGQVSCTDAPAGSEAPGLLVLVSDLF